jgi:phosphoribosyl 1,2-cyclic phosphodiesterase
VRFNVLGSGSSGNATLVVAGQTRILIDCGLSARELTRRFAAVGEVIDQLSAIIITHEHSDHIRGLATLLKHLPIPVFISAAAWQATKWSSSPITPDIQPLQAQQTIEIDQVRIQPIRIPHDSVDPLAFSLESAGSKIAIATDLGSIPPAVAQELRGCQALILEANHDLDMLKFSNYPWQTKQRVMSDVGHLSNREMARFLREDFDGQADYLILAHLSQQNNHPELARFAALEALAARDSLHGEFNSNKLLIAPPHQPLGWIDL